MMQGYLCKSNMECQNECKLKEWSFHKEPIMNYGNISSYKYECHKLMNNNSIEVCKLVHEIVIYHELDTISNKTSIYITDFLKSVWSSLIDIFFQSCIYCLHTNI